MALKNPFEEMQESILDMAPDEFRWYVSAGGMLSDACEAADHEGFSRGLVAGYLGAAESLKEALERGEDPHEWAEGFIRYAIGWAKHNHIDYDEKPFGEDDDTEGDAGPALIFPDPGAVM